MRTHTFSRRDFGFSTAKYTHKPVNLIYTRSLSALTDKLEVCKQWEPSEMPARQQARR